jgi:septal ring factor EnvC (AmiA/AmiB activator)
METGSRERGLKILFIASSLPLLLLLFHLTTLNAADPKRELTKIQKEIKKGKQKVKEAIKKERSILTELEEIDRSIKRKRSELMFYDKRLQQTRSKIERLEREIIALTGKINKRKRFLKERLRTLYKQRYGDVALFLISATDYQDLIRRSRYISLIAHYDSRLMETYSKGIKRFNLKKMQMEVLRKELEANKRDVSKKMQELQLERTRKDKLLASIRQKRSSYERMIKELRESSRQLREMIKRLEKKKLPTSVVAKRFRSMKGRLPWPVNGKVLVPFGRYRDPKFNIPLFKNGIEIKAKHGEVARAISSGRVVFADWFKGYGQLLIINHGGGYHSLYGYLSEIFYKTGDIIRRGEAIGKVGESGLLNVPALYFEIRYKGKPLDPLQWLKKKKTKKLRKRR